MKEKVVNRLMINISKKNNFDSIKLDEIKYGLYGIYTLVTKSIVIISLAIILGIFKEFIIFLLFYSLLRSVGFGCHARTNWQCWLMSTLLLIGIPFVFNKINLNNNLLVILWIIFFVNYTIFCPADTEKRPMINKRRKLKFKLVLLIISIIYLYIIVYFKNLSNLVLGAMLLECLLTNPLGYLLMGQKVRFKLNDIYLFKQE